ncbi:MAG: hypothetical protein LBT59_16880 [Clostridiales bacterium]|nr:hypothetical protein [Clostridiales bacterium]
MLTLISQKPIPGGLAKEYKHSSGAAVIHLDNKDTHRVFAAFLKTLPLDDRGAPHAVEHCVYFGSEKHPVDPFSQMQRSSLWTYLNAITYPDLTMLAASSRSVPDFASLAFAHLDLIYNPLLHESPDAFLQEVWRIEDGKPVGVILSEMRQSYSSSSQRAILRAKKALFKGSLSFDSAGVPEAILRLGWEDLKEYHRTRYVPANTLIGLYGDIGEDFFDELDRLLPEGRGDAPKNGELDNCAKSGSCSYVDSDTASCQDNKTIINSDCVGLFFQIPNLSLDLEIAMERVANALAFELSDKLKANVSPVSQSLMNCGLYGLLIKGEKGFLEKGFFDFNKGLDSLFGSKLETLQQELDSALFSEKEMQTGYKPQGLALLIRCADAWKRGEGLETRLDRFGAAKRLKELDPGLTQALALARDAKKVWVDGEAPLPAESIADLKPIKFAMGKSIARNGVFAVNRPDIPRDFMKIPERQILRGTPCVSEPESENGMAYISLCFDAAGLPGDQACLVPLAKDLLVAAMPEERRFMARKILSVEASRSGDTPYALLNLKCYKEEAQEWLDLLGLAWLESCSWLESGTLLESNNSGKLPFDFKMAISNRLNLLLENAFKNPGYFAKARARAGFGGACSFFELSSGYSALTLLSDRILHYNKMGPQNPLPQGATKGSSRLLLASAIGVDLEKVKLPEFASVSFAKRQEPHWGNAGLALPGGMASCFMCFPSKGIGAGALDVFGSLLEGWLDPQMRAKGAYAAGCGIDGGIFEMSCLACDASQALDVFEKGLALFKELGGVRIGEKELQAAKTAALRKRLSCLHPEARVKKLAELSLAGARGFDLAMEAEEIMSVGPGFAKGLPAFDAGVFCAEGNPELFSAGLKVFKFD